MVRTVFHIGEKLFGTALKPTSKMQNHVTVLNIWSKLAFFENLKQREENEYIF